MRKLPYITTGQIIERLKNEGLPISRPTFLRLEKKGVFLSQKTVGRWRVFTKEEADLVIDLIKENYGLKGIL